MRAGTQFPLMPAFALTVTKSQGQTLGGRVGVLLAEQVFAHGQLYVALGRVTDPANLRVWACGDVENCVYADVYGKTAG